MYMVTSSQPLVGDEPVALDENQCGIAADDNSRDTDKENASENDKISDSCEPNDIQRFPLNVIDLQSAGNKSKGKDLNNKISTGNSKIEPSTNRIGEGETKVNQFDNLKKQIKGMADAENQLYEKWKLINKLLGDIVQQKQKFLTISAAMYDNNIKIEPKLDQILTHLQSNDAHGRANVEVETKVMEFEILKKQLKGLADTQNRLKDKSVIINTSMSDNFAKIEPMINQILDHIQLIYANGRSKVDVETKVSKFESIKKQLKGMEDSQNQALAFTSNKFARIESKIHQFLTQTAQIRQGRTRPLEMSPLLSSTSGALSLVDINLSIDTHVHSREQWLIVLHPGMWIYERPSPE